MNRLLNTTVNAAAIAVSTWICYLAIAASQTPLDTYNLRTLILNHILVQRIDFLLLATGTLLCVALFNNLAVGIGVFDTLAFIFAIINHFKLVYRNESFLPSDFEFAKDAGELIGMIDIRALAAAIVGIALFVALIIFLGVKARQHLSLPFTKLGTRILTLVLCLLPWAMFMNGNNAASASYYILSKYFHDQPMFAEATAAATTNGPLVNFMNHVDIKTMDEPTGYSKATVLKAVNRYKKLAATINQTRSGKIGDQTVIYVLSETLANPNRLPFLSINSNPLKNIDKIKAANPSGLMMSSGFGGGTANMEYMALTSFEYSNFSATLPTPYQSVVVKQQHPTSVADLFGYKIGIHPYYSNMYNRKQVYQKLGFNKFETLDTSKTIIKAPLDGHPYASDASAFANVTRQLKTHKAAQFIQLSTMQNHLPFTASYADTDGFTITSSTLPASLTKTAANYAQGISITDKVVNKWIQSLDAIKRPITVVFYGDHLPSTYQTSLLKQYSQVMHETDYFIYSNKAARKTAQPVTNTKITSPNYFTSMLLQRTNSEVTPFYAMMTTIQHKVPAMSSITASSSNAYTHASGTEYTSTNGKFTADESTLSTTQQQLIHDYRIIQYDQTAGANYAQAAGFYKYQ